MPSIHRISTLSLLALALGAASFAGCAPESTPDETTPDDLDEDSAVAEATSALGTNLALGRPTTQSTTAVGGVASRAVDGNTDGNWPAGSVTHTSDSGWWQVDLESVQQVGTVVLFNRTDCCTERLQNFELLVSDDGAAWQSFPFPGVAGPQTTFAVNRSARYVKVQLNNGIHPLSLAEVQVFAADSVFPRGTASLPTCGAGLEMDAGLCYPSCAPGYHGAGPMCSPDAQAYGRGAGTIPPTSCGPGQQMDAGLCYPLCADGYQGVGPVCWQSCPAGYTDTGAFCQRDGQIIGANTSACPWYDTCGLTFAPGCSSCPAGYINDGCTCRIDPSTLAKSSYGRGGGTVPISACGAGQQMDAGLCYPLCAPGYHGVGPVCWPDAQPYGRGVGTIPEGGCAAGLEMDAGLCYPACAAGYHGVGPLCWNNNITFQSITAAVCSALYNPTVTELAQLTGQAHTFGFGGGLAAGANGTLETGVAYGPGGEFGCYVTACGGVVTNVSLSAWATTGVLTSFGGVAGDSVVTFAGLSTELPNLPVGIGGSVGIVTSPGGDFQGMTGSVSIGAGVSPVDLGVLACHTELVQVQ